MRAPLIITLILLACSCAHHDTKVIAVGWRAHYRFQPVPADIMVKGGNYLHEITLSRGRKTISFLGQVHIGEDIVKVTGFTPFFRIFSFEMGRDVEASINPVMGSGIRAEHFAADFQIAYWPAADITLGGLTVNEETSGIRKILKGNRLISTIAYPGGLREINEPVMIQNHSRNYTVHINPLP